MTSATFYCPSTTAPHLACADCGSIVDGSERGRALHTQWHEREAIVDLTLVRDESSAPVAEASERRTA